MFTSVGIGSQIIGFEDLGLWSCSSPDQRVALFRPGEYGKLKQARRFAKIIRGRHIFQ